jgi:hypothetical protein
LCSQINDDFKLWFSRNKNAYGVSQSKIDAQEGVCLNLDFENSKNIKSG